VNLTGICSSLDGSSQFDPETKRIMGVAFEMARAALARDWGDHANTILAKAKMPANCGPFARGWETPVRIGLRGGGCTPDRTGLQLKIPC